MGRDRGHPPPAWGGSECSPGKCSRCSSRQPSWSSAVAATRRTRVASLGNAAKNNPSASLDPKDAQLKFAQCMRQNGIHVADPKGDGGMMIQADENTDKAKMEKAMKTCQHFMQDSGIREAAKDPKIHDALVKYATCMRAHGVDMPDPGPDGSFKVKNGDAKGKGKSSMGIGGDDPASKACKNLLPNAGAQK